MVYVYISIIIKYDMMYTLTIQSVDRNIFVSNAFIMKNRNESICFMP